MRVRQWLLFVSLLLSISSAPTCPTPCPDCSITSNARSLSFNIYESEMVMDVEMNERSEVLNRRERSGSNPPQTLTADWISYPVAQFQVVYFSFKYNILSNSLIIIDRHKSINL